jgi:hypothetical protein
MRHGYVRSGCYIERTPNMNNLLRGGLAGVAAWKLGGGIIGMILIFIVVFYLLGYL